MSKRKRNVKQKPNKIKKKNTRFDKNSIIKSLLVVLLVGSNIAWIASYKEKARQLNYVMDTFNLTQDDLQVEELREGLVMRKMSDNTEVDLYDYKGKKTIIFFFASWCEYCEAALPEVMEAEEQLEDFEILYVDLFSMETDYDEIIKFAEDNDIYDRVLLDDEEGTLLNFFKIMGTPTNVFINSDGEYLAIPGYLEFNEIMEQAKYIN